MRKIRLYLLLIAFLLLIISLPAFAQEERILVVAPHPDDETLGCGGFIAKKAAAGAKIMVVIMTNGDGYTYSAELEFKKLTLSPSEYIRFAYQRQQETVEALEVLGLSSDNVAFLSYPDKGLEDLWLANWNYNQLYKSPYTKASQSPYASSYEREAPYCGMNVVKNLEEIFTLYKPTAIYVTTSFDMHPDHLAAFCFVSLALEDLKYKGEPFAGEAKIYTYLIHYPKWPPVHGLKMDLSILPPPNLTGLNIKWIEEPLTKEEEEKKREAILKYKSQVNTMGKYIFSAVRVNELFGFCPPALLPGVPDGSIKIDGEKDDWGDIEPVILQPWRESFLASLEGPGDITAVYACRDKESLYLRIDTRKKPNSSVYFDINFHTISGSDIPVPYSLKLKPPDKVSGNLNLGREDFKALHICELRIPLKLIEDPSAIILGANSRSFLFQIERSSYRVLELRN